jgi:hypothetical protein
MKYALLLLVGCASQQPPIYTMRPVPSIPVQAIAPNTMQELVMDKQIQPMGRNEVIDGVKQCESSGLRAIPIYAKRKINGYTVETVVEVTCGPRYTY